MWEERGGHIILPRKGLRKSLKQISNHLWGHVHLHNFMMLCETSFTLMKSRQFPTSWEDFRGMEKPYLAWFLYKPRLPSLFTGSQFLLSFGSGTGWGDMDHEIAKNADGLKLEQAWVRLSPRAEQIQPWRPQHDYRTLTPFCVPRSITQTVGPKPTREMAQAPMPHSQGLLLTL